MYESNAPEIIKYLTEDDLKLMYGRLNRRFVVVDALPAVGSLEPADKNVIYVVKETDGGVERYWPNVLEDNVWRPVGIVQEDLNGKIDKVSAEEGHLVVADENGNLTDAGLMPGTFVALAYDPSEQIQPHATDFRKIWGALQSGIPVILLDNRESGTGLYASLNAAGYTWPDGDHMAERVTDVDTDYRPHDDSIPGYYDSENGKFYYDIYHAIEIDPVDGVVYHDLVDDKVYLYADEAFTRVLRFVQFSANELVNDDPVWTSRKAARPVFFRIFEPETSVTANNFYVVYGEYTTMIKVNVDPEIMYGNGVEEPLGVYEYNGETAGLVPDAPNSDTDKKFLRADGQWETITIPEPVPADWEQVDRTKPDYIKNKPGVYQGATDEHPGSSGFVPAALSDERDLFLKGDGTWGKPESTPGDGKLYIALGNDRPVDTGFSANAANDAIVSIPEAASATAQEAAHGGLMTTADKAKLDEIDLGITPGTGADSDKVNIQLKNNISANVLTAHQDVSDKAEKSEMSITDATGDATKKNIQLKDGLSQEVVVAHQDISDKADKVTGAISGNFAGLDANGNLVDSGENATNFASAEQGTKADSAVQSVKMGSSSGTDLKDGTSVIIPEATQNTPGIMSTSDKTKLDGINNYIESATVSGRTMTLTPKSGPAVTFNDTGDINVIEKISVNGTQQTVTNKEVDLAIPAAANNAKITLKVGGAAAGDTTPVAGDFTVDQSLNKDIVIPAAVSASGNEPAKPGVMSSADKTKLDGIPEFSNTGTPGQVLMKTANGSEWANAPTELPSSGTAGQFLKKTANGVEYASVSEVPSGGTTGQVLTKTAGGEAWADAPKELPATTSADAGKALHVGSDGVPVFKFAELRQMPDVVQTDASDNGHIFTNNTYTKVILKYNTDQDLYSPQVSLASDELLNCIIDIYIDSTYSLDGHDLFIMFDIQRNGGPLKQIARPLTGDHFKHLENGSYIRIYALGDSWSAQVGIPWNTPGWLPCQLVPPAEAGDNGKMLQVLDTNGNLGWGIGIPAPSNGDVGKVLTVSTSEGHLAATWDTASSGGGGGGGGGYTRATAAFGEQYSKPYPWYPQENGLAQDITISNNTYTLATNFIPNYRYDDVEVKGTELVLINISADVPMAIVKFELNKSAEWLPEGADSFSFNIGWNPDSAIVVKNGDKTLKRLYPLSISNEASEASYGLNNLLLADVIEVHILGDSYTILSTIGPVEGLSV